MNIDVSLCATEEVFPYAGNAPIDGEAPDGRLVLLIGQGQTSKNGVWSTSEAAHIPGWSHMDYLSIGTTVTVTGGDTMAGKSFVKRAHNRWESTEPVAPPEAPTPPVDPFSLTNVVPGPGRVVK